MTTTPTTTIPNDNNNNSADLGPESAAATANVVLAPMVRGSEFAFRQTVRQFWSPTITTTTTSDDSQHHYDPNNNNNENKPLLCYTPMLRAEHVIRAYEWWQEQQEQEQPDQPKESSPSRQQERPSKQQNQQQRSSRHLHEDSQLFLFDTCQEPDDAYTVLQLCGAHPDPVYQAATAIFAYFFERDSSRSDSHQLSCRLHGIDFNLGCPQTCARQGEFGAFLAEERPERAVACVRALVQARRDCFQTKNTSSTTEDDDRKDDAKGHNNNNNTNNNHANATNKRPRTNWPLISAKIRLGKDLATTMALAQALQNAGCDVLAVHCRQRHVKFDGAADLEAGRAIVAAMQIPVYLNGAELLRDNDDNDRMPIAARVKQILAHTGAAKLMVAREFLARPDLLAPSVAPSPVKTDIATTTPSSSSSPSCDETTPPPLEQEQQQQRQQQEEPQNESQSPLGHQKQQDTRAAALATTYLTWAEKYPPPTHEYLQTHMKWFFRKALAPPSERETDYKNNWRHCLWNFLRRPYLLHLCQYQAIVRLFCDKAGCNVPQALLQQQQQDGDTAAATVPTYSMIRKMGKSSR